MQRDNDKKQNTVFLGCYAKCFNIECFYDKETRKVIKYSDQSGKKLLDLKSGLIQAHDKDVKFGVVE